MGYSMIERGTIRTYAYGRLEVIADRSQVYPDDPGLGTPLMVENTETGEVATMTCALSVGEIEYSILSDEEWDVLSEINDDAEDFLYG